MASQQSTVEKATEDIGCSNVQSKIFDSLYNYVNEKESLPDLNLLTLELETVIEKQLVEKQKVSNKTEINNG